eukprot:scaffold28647_cov19-Prasinocladus_malaysianus.AAC.1
MDDSLLSCDDVTGVTTSRATRHTYAILRHYQVTSRPGVTRAVGPARQADGQAYLEFMGYGCYYHARRIQVPI